MKRDWVGWGFAHLWCFFILYLPRSLPAHNILMDGSPKFFVNCHYLLILPFQTWFFLSDIMKVNEAWGCQAPKWQKTLWAEHRNQIIRYVYVHKFSSIEWIQSDFRLFKLCCLIHIFVSMFNQIEISFGSRSLGSIDVFPLRLFILFEP